MPTNKKIKIPIEREVIDYETGEVTKVSDELIIADIDFGDWFKIMNVEKEANSIPLDGLGKQFVVFYVILKRVIWDECSVDIGPATRAAITRHANIKSGMIRKYLKEYVSNKLMKKVTGNSYMINPTFFFKGGEAQQKKLYKIYQTHGKII